MASEQLTRSAEEDKLLKGIRDEKEKLWLEIQVELYNISHHNYEPVFFILSSANTIDLGT